MGDYIALHNQAGHLPQKFKHIPNDTVWVREDHWSPLSRSHIIGHETLEHQYMKNGMSYKQAHFRTQFLYP